MEELKLFIIRNKEGKYFRSKGYGGSGSSWVDLEKAKIYPQIRSARKQVSFWANNYPDYGIPDIIVLTVTGTEVLNEEDRVKKAILKRKKEKISRELFYANQKLKEAESRVRHLVDQKVLLIARQNVEKIENKLKSLI